MNVRFKLPASHKKTDIHWRTNELSAEEAFDVVVTVFDPAGKKPADIDSPNGAEGPEPVAIEATSSGPYILTSSCDTTMKEHPTDRHRRKQIDKERFIDLALPRPLGRGLQNGHPLPRGVLIPAHRKKKLSRYSTALMRGAIV